MAKHAKKYPNPFAIEEKSGSFNPDFPFPFERLPLPEKGNLPSHQREINRYRYICYAFDILAFFALVFLIDGIQSYFGNEEELLDWELQGRFYFVLFGGIGTAVSMVFLVFLEKKIRSFEEEDLTSYLSLLKRQEAKEKETFSIPENALEVDILFSSYKRKENGNKSYVSSDSHSFPNLPCHVYTEEESLIVVTPYGKASLPLSSFQSYAKNVGHSDFPLWNKKESVEDLSQIKDYGLELRREDRPPSGNYSEVLLSLNENDFGLYVPTYDLEKLLSLIPEIEEPRNKELADR